MIYTRLGAHVVTGPRNGYGQLVAAGMASVLAVGEGGALTEADAISPDTMTIYRTVVPYRDAPPGIDGWTVDQARAAAGVWFPQFAAQWILNPADYYTVLNEPAGNEPALYPVYMAFEERMAELAEAAGYRLCLLNLAGGTPGSLEQWQQYYVPYLSRLCARGHIYGRHAYGGLLVRYENGQAVPYDDNVGRPMVEAAYLAQAAPHVKMVITELGTWGGYELPPPDIFTGQAMAYDSLLQQHGEIIAGSCLYSLGEWGSGSNWSDSIPQIANWISMVNSSPPPPPPPSLYKKVLHLLPQELTWDEFLAVCQDAGHAFENRNTITRSHDDAIYHMTAPDIRADSILFFWWPDRWPAEVRNTIEALAPGKFQIVYVPAPPPPPDGDPLAGLVLGPAFRVPHQVTSTFNAPRDYGNGLHEGIDLDIIGGPADSKEPVLAVYMGVVDKVRLSTGAYFNYCVIRHERNGGTFYTWYCHMDAVFVQEGQEVYQGQPVGELGGTGGAWPEHLHLNLQVPGRGLAGYVVADVVDPGPYITLDVPSQDVDLLPYLQGDGRVYQVQSWINGQENNETMHAQAIGLYWLQVKNAQWEELWADDTWIWRGADTSPGGGRYYTLTDPGRQQRGSRWILRYMRPGQTFDRNPFVQFYDKATCTPDPNNSGQSASWIGFTALHPSYTFRTGITLQDVVQLSWQGLETYYYARGYGLVGWSSHNGDWSAIRQLGGLPQEPEAIPCLD